MRTLSIPALITASVVMVSTAVTAETLSPTNGVTDWSIPSGYANLTVEVKNYGWAKNLYMPTTGNHGDIITIVVTSAYPTTLDLANTDVPLSKLNIANGQSVSFTFDSTIGKWKYSTAPQYPVNGSSSSTVTLASSGITHFSVKNGGWTGRIYLPSTANNDQLVLLSSTAAYATQVDTGNILFPSNYTLKSGQNYWFKFNTQLAKWVPVSIQPSVITIGSSTLGAPPTAITNYVFQNDTISQVTLPASAKDRDRIIITSNASQVKTINNNYLATNATLKINNGERYEFMYIADRSHWVLMTSPRKVYQASQLLNGYMPNSITPVTEVISGDGNYQSNITLPDAANIDDKVIFRSKAGWAYNVRASNGLVRQITNGETVRFINTVNGWQVATNTVDMLLVNSPEVDNVLGQSAAKIRLMEAMDLTNTTAENSDANYYVRPVGYITYKIPGTILHDVLVNGRDDQVVQNERTRVKADGVYYQGNESDPNACGWAWIKATKYNMIAMNNVSCGVAAARHEIGHNLGLYHAGETTLPAQGFRHPLGSTAMGGNNMAYYSSPYLYNPTYGVRLGEVGKIDAVAQINSFSGTIAGYN